MKELLKNNRSRLIWFFVIAIILISIVYLFVKDSPEYVEVETVAERIGSNYVVLHEAISSDERIGLSYRNVVSPLYNKNEGWLLRNKTIYCSNRLIDDIDNISNHSEIYRYTGNPNGTQFFMNLERFKTHLVSLDEICVEEGEFMGEKVLEATLFISPEKKIWVKNE